MPLQLKTQRLINALNTIKEEASNIWKRPLDGHFTDHSINHSERIVCIVENILKNKPLLLNESERFVLLSAIYLHDIGMQFPIYAGLPKKNLYTSADLKKVRDVHHETSAAIILKSVESNCEVYLGLKNCSEFVIAIAEVAKHHRRFNINQMAEISVAGEKLKLPLLAALLSLSDELDYDFRRVDMNLLKQCDIPTESKFHWWSHHYVQSVDIEDGKVTLYFRFPEIYRNNNLAKDIKDGVIKNITQKYDLGKPDNVYETLYKYGVGLFPKPLYGQDTYTTGVETMPHDLVEHLQNQKKLSLVMEKNILDYNEQIIQPQYHTIPQCNEGKLLELLYEACSYDDLKVIIFSKFNSQHNKLSGMDYQKCAIELIDWCKRQGRLSDLLAAIKEKNEYAYKKYENFLFLAVE